MNRKRLVITKENLINLVSSKCKEDFVSIEDLFEIINKATDEDGVLSKKALIRAIRDSHTRSVVKNIYNLLEDAIFDSLSSVDSTQDVSIRLFEGINFDCEYIPEREMMNNLTGKMTLVKSKVKPKFNITRSYCEKLNGKR